MRLLPSRDRKGAVSPKRLSTREKCHSESIMPVTIENQVILVVGASSGIGRETAVLFAREGARVMASARRAERLRELKESLAREGRTVETLAADAAEASQMENL